MTSNTRGRLAIAVCAVTLAVAAGGAQGNPRPHASERSQPRAEPRPAPRPSPPRPTRRGGVIFIGGYFYDPFFGPYPWWPRGAYPPWYYPVYDHHAEVRVACTPRDAAVYVDGFYAGVVDDFDGAFQRLALPPGGHRIALYLDGYVTEEFGIYLRPRSTFTLRHTMLRLPPDAESRRPDIATPVPPPPDGTYTPPRGTPPVAQSPVPSGADHEPGTLDLRVQPTGAVVTIDGAPWRSSDPGRYVVELPAGRHHVEVSAPGYRTFTADVDVAAGDTAPLNVSLGRTGLR
jgi:hypothetical protein